MINNYPVKNVKIMGRVLSCRTVSSNKDGKVGAGDFLILQLDDFSGEHSTIFVKAPHSSFSSLASIEPGLLVEATGIVYYRPNYSKQLLACKSRIVGNQKDFGCELKWWATVLSIRRFLIEPWAYIPAKNTHQDAVIPRFQPKSLRFQREKKRVLRSMKDDSDKRMTSALTFAKDSVLSDKISRKSAPVTESSTKEVFCLTDSDSPTIEAANEMVIETSDEMVIETSDEMVIETSDEMVTETANDTTSKASKHPSVTEVIDLTED